MPVTSLDIANSALIKLGERTISALSDQTAPAQAANTRIEFCRRAVLRTHPWNFAVRRATLSLNNITGIADNGGGLCRVTSALHGFSSSNKVSISGVRGTSEANGTWTITVIDPNTFDLIGSSFVNTYIDGGVVGLAAEYGWTFQHLLPTNCLRLLIINTDEDRWRIEGRYILSNESSLQIKYIVDHTDYDTMDSLFHEALAAYLAWDICYRVTQNLNLKNQILEDYSGIVKRARFVDATEEPAETIGADDFLDSRSSGATQFVRDPMT